MKRCSLYWVLSLFAFVVMVLLFNSSSCYAYSLDEFADFCSTVVTNNNASSMQKTLASWVVNNVSNIKSRMTDYSRYNSWQLGYQISGSSISWYRIWGMEGGSFDRWNTSNKVLKSLIEYNCIRYNPGNGQWLGYDGSNIAHDAEVGLIYEACPNFSTINFTGRMWNNELVTTEYLVFVNDIENSAYNGNIFTYYIQGDFYSFDKIKIGTIIPNDSYYYEVRLKDSVTEIVKGTSFVALNTSPNTYYNDGALIIDNTGVYIVPRLLKYSQQYQLEITSYYGDGGDNLYEDIDWFIFLPFNAVVSGDHILNLGSGDYTTQDSTNDIMGFLGNYTFPSGDIQGIINSDGSLLSGDLFDGVQMPVLDGMKNYNLFDLLRAIGDCVGGSGDAYFDFQMHGETPTRIYASQFRTPDGALKTLVSSFLVFFTFYFLVLQLRHVLEMLTTANIKGAIDYVDSSMDNMFYM